MNFQNTFVGYTFAGTPTLAPMGKHLYEYVVGANGIFVRARRPGLEALIWVASTATPIRGLAMIEPYVHIDEKVPVATVKKMLVTAYRNSGKEILYYLKRDPWHLTIPEQIQSGSSVLAIDPFAGGTETMVEVHSHHDMGTFFSVTDDREERAGFRIYSVIGNIGSDKPSILTRVGIYGHFWQIPSNWVYNLPNFINDTLCPELEYEDIENVA